MSDTPTGARPAGNQPLLTGRAAWQALVEHAAASVAGFIDFAVGRTTFWDAVAGCRAKTLRRAAGAAQIARRLRDRVDVFERERAAGADHITGATP